LYRVVPTFDRTTTGGELNGEVAVGLHASVEGLVRIASLDHLAGPAADAVKTVVRLGRLARIS
jgi:hypothetical protein